MKKLITLMFIIGLLPLVLGAGNNWKLYFSDGITTINGTDVCVDDGTCLSDAAGDITAVNTPDSYLYGGADSGIVNLYVNDTYAGINLAVNSSDYWDNLGSPSDINAGDITDDGTWRLQSWDNITGIPTATPSDGDTTHFSLADEIYDFVVALIGTYTHLSNFTDDLGDRGYTHLTNFTNDLGISNYSHLTNFTDDLGDRGYTSISNFTNDFGFYNSTDFSISNYYTSSQIDGFSYYNSTDFSIADYYTSTQTDTAIETANTTIKTYVDVTFEPVSQAHFNASATMNITCLSQACDWYTNATDNCMYWQSGGKTCGAS